MLNLPLGDALAARVNFGLRQRDGFSTNLANGNDDGDKKLVMARGQLLWEGDTGTRIHFSADYAKNDPDTSVTPSVEEVSLVGDLVGIEDASTDPFKIDADFNHLEELTSWGAALTAEFAVSDALTLKSITSYRELEHDAYLDLDGDDGAYFGVFVHQMQDQFTQELQALYDSENLQAVVGLYYFEESDITPDGVFGPDADIAFFQIDGITQGLSTASTNDLATESWAIFGEFSVLLDERWELTAGARYTRDEKSSTRIYDDATGFGNSDVTLDDLSDASASSAAFRSAGEKDFSAFTPKLGLSYQANENTLLYLSASRGFKSGGFNGHAREADEAEPFEEETVTAYELGLKSTLYDGRMIFNAAIFRNDYEDMQLSSFGADQGATFIAIFTNAGEATTQGIELEWSAAPTETLQLRAHFGYLDAEYDEYNAPNLRDGTIMDLSGLTPIQSPEFNYGVGFDWTLSENPTGRFVLSGQYSGVDSYYTTVMNAASLREDGYQLLNLSLQWENADATLSATLAAKNLTDEEYIVHGFDILSYPGVALAYYGEPATYEFQVRWNF